MPLGPDCWRWLAVALLAAQPPAALAHGKPEAGVIVLADSPRTLRLIASKTYQPARRSNAEADFERVVRFAVPAEIAVIRGDAGDHLAYLAFAFAHRYEVCVYRGTAHRSGRPGGTHGGRGTKYLLKACSHRLHAGDEVTADFLRLSILSGDPRAGPTAVQLVLLDLSAPAPPPASELARSGLDKARAGNYAAAVEDYSRALQQDPRDTYAYAYRSQSLRALGQTIGAEADIRRVLELRLEAWEQDIAADPGDADNYAGRAATRLSLGDARGAIDDYSAALYLRPGHARSLLGLGNARYRDGDRNGALAEYGLALAADPGLIEAYVARAIVRAALGDLDGANADRQEARLKTPTDQVSR
jgi:tetratricopeptide (TPR) repeat protein